MSEEVAAFAGRNQLDDPFPIVPDDELATVSPERNDAAPSAAVTQNASAAHLDGAAPAKDFGDAEAPAADPITGAALAEDSQRFLQALIGVAAADARRATSDMAGPGLSLSILGQALADGAGEEQAFQDLVDAFERRRFEEPALHSVAPFVAMFVARLVSAPYRHDTTPEIVENLMRSAEEVVGAALQAAGARGWRRLPDIATTIAERAAHRGLSVADLIEALPRLATRFGLGSRGPAMRVASSSDHPRAEAAERPRRMHISGPVEIVILDR